MFRAKYFVDAILKPELAFYRSAMENKDSRYIAMSQASVFEGFLWLRLGVEVGFITAREANAVSAAYLSEYFRSLAPSQQWAETEGLRLVFPRGEIPLLDSPRFVELLALFPDSETELRSAIRKGDLLSSESGDFAEPHVLTTPFQTLMLITSDFLQDRIARTCIGALTFWTPVTWEAAMKDSKITASESVIAIPKNEDESLERSNAALLYAGLLRILHHMEAFRDFWRAFIDSDLVQETDPVALLRRVQQIQRWRVNLGSSQTFSRVHQLVADLQSKLISELKDNRASNDAERSLIVSIANFPDFALSLVSFWSGSGQALAATV